MRNTCVWTERNTAQSKTFLRRVLQALMVGFDSTPRCLGRPPAIVLTLPRAEAERTHDYLHLDRHSRSMISDDARERLTRVLADLAAAGGPELRVLTYQMRAIDSSLGYLIDGLEPTMAGNVRLRDAISKLVLIAKLTSSAVFFFVNRIAFDPNTFEELGSQSPERATTQRWLISRGLVELEVTEYATGILIGSDFRPKEAVHCSTRRLSS
jgi:hypothetical protein